MANCIRVENQEQPPFKVYACPQRYGKMQYDFVRVRNVMNPGQPWFARVLALLGVDVLPGVNVHQDGLVYIAIVQWLERTEEDVIPGAATFTFSDCKSPGFEPIAVCPTVFQSLLHFVQVPDERENPVPQLAALPYGKSAAFNGVF